MAQYRSADSAVSVKTDTPMLMSFPVSDILQMVSPHGHDSRVYITDTKGTQISITSKSASARENMYLQSKICINLHLSKKLLLLI